MKKKKKALTDKQVDTLGNRLHGTTGNVFKLAETVFGVEVGDEIFDRLEKVAKVFRCEECSVWQNLGERDIGYLCSCCMEEMNEDDGD